MNFNISSLIEYISIFLISILIINYAVNLFFAKFVKRTDCETQKHCLDEHINTELEEEDWPPTPPEPIYGIYHPFCFSKELTRVLYQKVVIQKLYFLDELWMETFCELLILLELADEVSVIKENAKVIHLVNGTRGMQGAETAELYEAYNLYELSLQSINELISIDYRHSVEKFQLKVIAMLLLNIDEITSIHHWNNVQDNLEMKRIELVKYMTRKLSSEHQEYISDLIKALHNSFDESDCIYEITVCISMAKSKLKSVTKLVKENSTYDVWPKSLLTNRLKKEYLTIEEIQNFR